MLIRTVCSRVESRGSSNALLRAKGETVVMIVVSENQTQAQDSYSGKWGSASAGGSAAASRLGQNINYLI